MTSTAVRRAPLRASSGLAGVAWAFGALVATRLLGLVTIVVALDARSSGRSIQAAMSRFDGYWYLLAARQGWPHHVPRAGGHVAQSTIAFFPGFPLLIRAVANVPGVSYFAAAVIVEIVFQFTMLLLVWMLAADIWGEEVAKRAVVLVAIFPGAFIFSMLYCEPLMLTLALACLLALRRRRWLAGGICAGLATAVSPSAVALCVACAAAAVVAIAKRREWTALIAPLLSPAGIIAYLAYLWASTGNIRAWTLTERQGWHEQLKVLSFKTVFDTAVKGGGSRAPMVVLVIGTVVAMAMLVLYVLAKPRSFDDTADWWLPMGVFALVSLGLAFFSNILGLRPRFVLTALPLLLVLASRARRVWFALICVLSGVLMVLLLGDTVTSLTLIP